MSGKNPNYKSLELKVPVFVNKRTGQRSIVLPKKKFEKFIGNMEPNDKVKISLWRPVDKSSLH